MKVLCESVLLEGYKSCSTNLNIEFGGGQCKTLNLCHYMCPQLPIMRSNIQ